MGWDTEVIIIAEKVKSVNSVKEIGILIFEKDSKYYEQESSYIIQEGNEFSLFFHYERRKYLPHWVIKEISSKFKDVSFTMLGSCPDFVGGPAGIIKIKAGQILDSYGIGSAKQKLIREEIVSNPNKYKELIYDWFKSEGKEERARLSFIDKFPMMWCNDNFVDRLIPIEDTDYLEKAFKSQSETNQINEKWTIQPNFKTKDYLDNLSSDMKI